MPKAWSSKDERQYEHIEESETKAGRGTKRAKEIAARTVNKNRSEQGRTEAQRSSRSTKNSSKGSGPRNSRRKRGRSGTEQTRAQLYERAKKLGIEGRSSMNKSQLARAVRGR